MTMSNAKGVYNIIFSKIVKIYTKLIYDKYKQLEKNICDFNTSN